MIDKNRNIQDAQSVKKMQNESKKYGVLSI